MSGYFKWDSGGGMSVGARVYNNANISIGNATNTILTFNSERWDTTAGIHSLVTNTSRLTCPIAGKYLIGGNVRWDANATGVRDLQILLNNTTYIGRVYMGATAAINYAQSIVTLYDLAAGDYVELRVYQNSGGALDVLYASAYSPEMWMQRIA